MKHFNGTASEDIVDVKKKKKKKNRIYLNGVQFDSDLGGKLRKKKTNAVK